METKNDLIQQNKVFGLIAAATGAILSIPYLAMQFNWIKPDPSNPADMGVNWTLSDFVIMGTLLFGAGSIFVLVARATPKKYRLPIAIGFIFLVLWIWAELAVGVLTNIGS